MKRSATIHQSPFDTSLANYDATCTEYVTDPFEYPEFFETIKNKQNKHMLVVGCGPADDAASLKQLGFTNILGIDLSKGMVMEAHNRHPDIEVRLMAMQDVSKQFKIEEFDGIVGQYSLFTVPKQELKQTIAGFAKVLKPKGFIYITTQESMTGEPIETFSIRDDYVTDVYVNAETAGTLEEIFSDHGFRVKFIRRRNPRIEEHQFFKLTMIFEKLSK